MTSEPTRRYRRVSGYVWCHVHGTVHEAVDTLDPFDEECVELAAPADHKPLYRLTTEATTDGHQ